jgi:hypothetical protein
LIDVRFLPNSGHLYLSSFGIVASSRLRLFPNKKPPNIPANRTSSTATPIPILAPVESPDIAVADPTGELEDVGGDLVGLSEAGTVPVPVPPLMVEV